MSIKGKNVLSRNVKEEQGLLELDRTSSEGKFSWHLVSGVTPDVCLPQVLRTRPDGSTVGYISVKMAEKTLLDTFLKSLPYEVMRIPRVLAHPIMATERKLLFEINKLHCDSHFGEMVHFTKDHLINSEEFTHYCTFLSLSLASINSTISQGDNRFGFLRINGTGDVPYVLVQQQKLIPLFYFEEAGTETVSKVSVSDWDWAYLKFCCKVQGVKDSMLTGSVCPCITEQEVKTMLPEGTSLEEYWPKKNFLNKSVRSKACKDSWWISTSTSQDLGNMSSGAGGPSDTRTRGT